LSTTSRTAYWIGALIFFAVATAADAHPATRAFSVLLGGGSWDGGSNVAVDAAGDVWLVGGTYSPDFPFTAGSSVSQEIFIARLSPGGELLSATSLGGRDSDLATTIALDAGGNVYVAGSTLSPDFPVTTSLARPGTRQRVFVAKLDPRGRIVYSTVFGGTRNQHITGLDVDAGGHAFVTGFTDSPDFPTAGALFPSLAGQIDIFVTKLSPDGLSLLYSTYLGGPGLDAPLGIALDAAGNAHVAGYTALSGSSQAVVAKLSPDGSQLIYSTLLGGSGLDWAKAVAIDPAGNALVYGETTSTDFPVRAALQPAPVPGPNGEPPFETFLARLGPDGSLISLTYFGGSGEEGAMDIAVDGAGSIYLLGYTTSSDFPLRDPLPIDVTPSWYFHVGFVTKLDARASEILFSTLLDGTEEAQGWAYGIAADASGSIYVTGESNDPHFPIIGPSQRTEVDHSADAFALKIELNGSPSCSAATASPAVIWPPNGKMVSVSLAGVSDPDDDPLTLQITRIAQDEPLSGKEPDAAGLGTSRPMLRASRAGNGDGRVYHITFTATDPAGAACVGTVTVCVPHDPGKRTCGDGGPLFVSIR
jgi:hypothetical protein